MHASHRPSRPPIRRALPALLVALAPLATCGDGGRGIAEPTSAAPRQGGIVPASGAPLSSIDASDFPLRVSVTSSVPAFEVKQLGSGIAGRFEITDPNSAAIALDGVSAGTGHGLLAWNLGLGRGAVIITSNTQNTLPALDVSSQSLGTDRLAAAADIRANNSNATAPAMRVTTLGQGAALQVQHHGTAGDLAVFQTAGANVARIDREGAAFFNGGTKNKGADVAEEFAVEGARSAYEPGDVLVVSTRTDRRVERSARAYSTAVIGVYATRPGVLLTERDVDDDTRTDLVPVGVLGVIPTKVSAENGSIRRGDLLVTARTPGHAMRGTARGRMLGAVVGKALAEFRGPGTGVINVLVNVR